MGNASTLTVDDGVTSLRLGDEYWPVDLITDVRHLGVRHLDLVIADDPGEVTVTLAGRISVGRIVSGD